MSKRRTRAIRPPTTGAKSGRTRRVFLTGAAVLAISAMPVWTLLELEAAGKRRIDNGVAIPHTRLLREMGLLHAGKRVPRSQ